MVLARPSRSRDISTSAVASCDGRQWVIALGAGVAVVASSFLGQSVAILCPCPACAEATNW